MLRDNLVPRGHIDEGIFTKGTEDKQKTSRHPNIYGLDVRHSWQVGVDADAQICHRQNSQESQGHSGWDCVNANPEWNPREDDDEEGWKEDLDGKVTYVSLENEVYLQTREAACLRCLPFD